jgi:hypothetical protein
MKKMKLKGVFLVVGLTMLFAMTPIAHAGEGGPPVGYSYDPPPYSGWLTLTYDSSTDDVTVFGTVFQRGQSGCDGVFFGYSIPYSNLNPDKPFAELRPGDLQGITFRQLGGMNFDCLPEAYLQVVGVGRMTWNGDSEFSANFVIMALQ